jgi:nucleoid-associated protein YgaU
VQIDVASKDKIWALTANGDIYQRENDAWKKKIPQSGAISLSVGTDGEVWYVDASMKSKRLAGATWVQVTDRPMLQMSVRNATEVWGVNIAGELWQWLNGLWRKLEHPAFTYGRKYTVKRGDTLSGIALKLSIPYTALRRANPQITNPDRIDPGQIINLPD